MACHIICVSATSRPINATVVVVPQFLERLALGTTAAVSPYLTRNIPSKKLALAESDRCCVYVPFLNFLLFNSSTGGTIE